MAEIKHVEVKKLSGDKIVISVYCRELKSWATVTFEVDDERCRSLFCVVDIHGRGQSNKAIVAPDFVSVNKEKDCVITVWNNENGE